MKIITIIGARPQFIKASAVSRAIHSYNQVNSDTIEEIIVHTGQHYDQKMSDIFFKQLNIPQPQVNLGIVEQTHGAMTGRMLQEIEKVLMEQHPDMVLVYGDTNSTLAGALAAVKLHIPVAHVEAGLRSFNMSMPEEVNRILTDRISTMLFCPTVTAVENLSGEGVREGVLNVGDVMYDVTKYYQEKAREQFALKKWGLFDQKYVLCTVHRAENTDDATRLKGIFSALQKISKDVEVVLPLHPRTLKILKNNDLVHYLEGLHVLDPVSYLEITRLQMSAFAILTDSGGMQKEAFFHEVPCLTLRDETEWVETVQLGWNSLCGANKEIILKEWDVVFSRNPGDMVKESQILPYGDGTSADAIVRLLESID